MEYKVYTARLNYNENNNLICKITANNIHEVKEYIKKNHNHNPFYSVIFENNKEIYNNHLPIYLNKRG